MRSAVDLTIQRLLSDVEDGIRVLQSRDGFPLSDLQIRERARNIVMGLILNYRIESCEDERALEEAIADAVRPSLPLLG
ncbi:MAG TPA: hypothetical protein VIU64_17110 [Polyangia bacterium]